MLGLRGERIARPSLNILEFACRWPHFVFPWLIGFLESAAADGTPGCERMEVWEGGRYVNPQTSNVNDV